MTMSNRNELAANDAVLKSHMDAITVIFNKALSKFIGSIVTPHIGVQVQKAIKGALGVAQNYTQTSLLIEELTPEEKAWWEGYFAGEVNLTNREVEAADGLDCRDTSDEVDECDDDCSCRGYMGHADVSFERYSDCRNDLIWIRAEESFYIDDLAKVLVKFLHETQSSRIVRFHWANTCNKMRVGEFSGGCLVVTKDGYKEGSTNLIESLITEALKKGVKISDIKLGVSTE